jgi:glucosylceramidase
VKETMRSRGICAKTLHLILLIFGSSLIFPAFSQEVAVYVTSKAGDRIASKPALYFVAKATRPEPDFRIDDTTAYQKIDGFGASLLEAGPICLDSLDVSAQEAVLRALFDAQQGAGFSAMKTVIGATDFQPAGPYYTYDDLPGDLKLLHFSIARDLQPTGLIPYIKRARQYGNFVLQAPMDYPPDWMLFDVQKNQDVNPRYFPVLARYYLRYLRAYEENGIFIHYLSPFNEPGIYTKIPVQKIRNLLRNYVGPLFAEEGVKAKIEVCDFGNREDASKGLPGILDDAAARKYVGGISYHGYEFKDYDKIAAIHERYPDLPIWMTEVDHSYGTDTPRSHPIPRYDYEDGDFWGNQIISDLESGASAWIYWNLILDERGGPYLLSEVHRDGPNNYQHPVVIINRKTKQVTYTALYYYLAHFSKFVRPGAYRIGTEGTVAGLRCIAFKLPEGGMVAEVLNSQTRPVKTGLRWRGKVLEITLPALSITTCLWNPPSRGDALP